MPKPEVTANSALFERGVCQFLTLALAEATKSNWEVSSNETSSDKPLNSRDGCLFPVEFQWRRSMATHSWSFSMRRWSYLRSSMSLPLECRYRS